MSSNMANLLCYEEELLNIFLVSVTPLARLIILLLLSKVRMTIGGLFS